ncbi:MAG: hypothetical protein K2Q26_03420 [Bdellovibrionales bacterium]|nr:hypothetical protein [Bdellovibrionales bacterium]
MKTLFLFVFISLITWGLDSHAESLAACPVNMDLQFEERGSFTMLNARLSHLRDHYGKPTFNNKLISILEVHDAWARTNLIEISHSYMERIDNLVQQQFLKNLIAMTVGLDDPQWELFERAMRNVTLFDGLTYNKWGKFTSDTLALVKKIETLSPSRFQNQNLSLEAKNLMKARAVAAIASMSTYLERWDQINRVIVEERARASGRQFAITSVTVASSAILIGSLVYSGPIVVAAGTFARGFAADAFIAGHFTRIGQVMGGVGLGAAGAPTAKLLSDSLATNLEASRHAANRGTLLSCELDKAILAWGKRGYLPYLQASVAGGVVGLGGVATFSTLGSRALLVLTTFGVGVAQISSLHGLSSNSILSLAEYRMAVEAINNENRDLAKHHLERSRYYAQLAGERGLESIVVGALSVSIVGGLKSAVIEGEKAIRIMFANSSDTIPTALNSALDVIN